MYDQIIDGAIMRQAYTITDGGKFFLTVEDELSHTLSIIAGNSRFAMRALCSTRTYASPYINREHEGVYQFADKIGKEKGDMVLCCGEPPRLVSSKREYPLRKVKMDMFTERLAGLFTFDELDELDPKLRFPLHHDILRWLDPQKYGYDWFGCKLFQLKVKNELVLKLVGRPSAGLVLEYVFTA